MSWYPNYLEAVEAHKEIVEEDGITVDGQQSQQPGDTHDQQRDEARP